MSTTIVKATNFVKSIDPKTGELVGRRDMPAGKQNRPLPGHRRRRQLELPAPTTRRPGSTTRSAMNGAWTSRSRRPTPVTEPQAQLNIGATFKFKDPPPATRHHGHLDARDPITGKVAWTVDFPEPPLASLLSTAGGLVFVPDARGWLHAYDAKTGKELWQGNDGAGITAASSATRPAASSTSLSSPAGQPGRRRLRRAIRRPYKTMEKDTGSLVVYTLE